MVNFVHFDPLQSYLGHSVQFGHIRYILSTLVLFNLFCPFRSYSIHIASIHSTSVQFGPIQPTSVMSVLFHPIWSSSVHFVHFGLIWSILSTLVLFDRFVLIQSIQSYSLYFVHFFQFGPIRSIQITSIHFGPLRSMFLHLIDMFGLKTPNLNPNLLLKKILNS